MTSEQQATLGVEDAPLLVLLDGHAMVYRAFLAIDRPLTVRSTGEEVRGVYGFTQMLLRAIDDLRPTHLVLTFDRSGPTFRHELYHDYKATRPEMDPELSNQFPHVRRLMEAMRVPIMELDEFEADDLLGTLSAQAAEQGVDTVIVTGDTDTLQLVGPRVRVLMQRPGGQYIIYGETEVQERYGGLTAPQQVIDHKALCGDTSDNIPGIPGVGNKTAIKLLLQYGDIPGIYEHLDELPARQTALFEEHRDRVFQGRTLVTIVRDAPVTLDLDDARWGTYNRAEVVEVLKGLEFFSTINRIPGGESDGPVTSASGEAAAPAPEIETNYTTVRDAAAGRPREGAGRLGRLRVRHRDRAGRPRRQGRAAHALQPRRPVLRDGAGPRVVRARRPHRERPVVTGAGAGGAPPCPGGPGGPQGRPQRQL